MNASPADQRRLLEVADLDARIRKADNARKNPPQAARVQELLAQRQGLSHELSLRALAQGQLVREALALCEQLLHAQRQGLSHELSLRQGARDDLRAEIARIESDVAVVDARIARDAERLASSSNTKEVQGLESELQALARRKSDLEDSELDAMDRLEQADASVAEQETAIAATNAEGAELSAEAKRVVAEATAASEAGSRDRSAVAATIPADLLALYDRLAVRSAGAAALVRRTCEGCHMVLSGTDLQTLRAALSDAVVTCPECGCILVRTEESGL